MSFCSHSVLMDSLCKHTILSTGINLLGWRWRRRLIPTHREQIQLTRYRLVLHALPSPWTHPFSVLLPHFLGSTDCTFLTISIPMALTVGDRAPSLSLEDHQGNNCSVAARNGTPLVLFFYPKDETPGCTAEACGFRDSHGALQEMGAEVWGVSGDDVVSHRRFADRHQLPFSLLSDSDQGLRRAFGVPKTLGLLPSRVTYVIDGEGVIRHVFNNLLDGPAHVREAMQVLRTLQTQA